VALPVSFLTLTLNDNTVKANGEPESGSITLPIITITAANFTAQAALHADLINGLEGITIGNPAKTQVIAAREVISTAPASTPQAQRENKFLMRYHGVTLNQKFQASIPTADLDQVATNSEFVPLGSGAGASLKSAFEAVVRSPDDAAEAVVLDSVQFVGRNT
jgi:hypothetical protein